MDKPRRMTEPGDFPGIMDKPRRMTEPEDLPPGIMPAARPPTNPDNLSCWEKARNCYYEFHPEEFKPDALAHVGLNDTLWGNEAYRVAVDMAEAFNKVPNGGFPWSDCLEYLGKLTNFGRRVVDHTHDVTFKGPQVCVSVPLSELDNDRSSSIVAIRVEDDAKLAAAFVSVEMARTGVRFSLVAKGKDFRTQTKPATATAKINPKIKRG